jgi:hypothetical protein
MVYNKESNINQFHFIQPIPKILIDGLLIHPSFKTYLQH